MPFRFLASLGVRVSARVARAFGMASVIACTPVLAAAADAAASEPASAASHAASCPPPTVQLTPAMAGEGMRNARDRGFLWRISKDEHTSYLYGTIHVARLEWIFPGPSIVGALRASDTVALELDLVDPALLQRLAASIAAARNDPLPPDLTARLKQRTALECIDNAPFATMIPALQVATLTFAAARRSGLDPAYAIDAMLAGFGHSAGKAVVSLETPEAQIQALQMPTPAETTAFVEESLGDLEGGRAMPLLDRIARTWSSSDYDELQRYAEWCECLRTPADRLAARRMLDERNPAMAASIDALHASGKRVFAAVGSLHMIGPVGLPALMRERGYAVEEVRFAH